MEKNIKNEYHITVNDNVFGTKNVGFHAVLMFIMCFAAQFIIACILEQFKIISNEHIKDNLPEIALVISVIIVCVYYYISEKRTNGVMCLEVSFLSDNVNILINGREYTVKYDEIAEVDKMMVIDRIHDEKGCYRMKIKCHGRSNLEFETTAQEYENIWILKIRNCLFFMMRVREQELSAVKSVCLTAIQIGNGMTLWK